MQTERIVLTRAHNTATGGDYWYSKPGAIRYTLAEILADMRNGVEFEFQNGSEDLVLLSILAFADKGATSNTSIDFTKTGDIKLLNRIIKSGGFLEYIDTLEQTIRYEKAGIK